MKVLVTGAAGFIGMHSSRTLLARGHEVTGVDNLNTYYDPALKRARLEELRPQRGFSFHKLDIADDAAVAGLFEAQRFDCVLHLAAQAGVRYSLEHPMAYVTSNVAGFMNVLEGCRLSRVPHLVYASSSSVYGANRDLPFREEDRVDSPISMYAATKRANELMATSYAHLHGMPCTGLRFFTVYGPWGRPDQALFIFTRAILEGRPIRVFNEGRMKRDFTYIDDVVEAVLKIVERPFEQKANRVFNIGNGAPVELMDFVRAVERALGRKALVEMAPMQPGDVEGTFAATDRLRAEYGYTPSTPVARGVERFVEWYRAYVARSGGIAA